MKYRHNRVGAWFVRSNWASKHVKAIVMSDRLFSLENLSSSDNELSLKFDFEKDGGKRYVHFGSQHTLVTKVVGHAGLVSSGPLNACDHIAWLHDQWESERLDMIKESVWKMKSVLRRQRLGL